MTFGSSLASSAGIGESQPLSCNQSGWMKSLPFSVMGVAKPARSYIDENKDTTRRLVVREEEELSALVNADGSLSRRVSLAVFHMSPK